MTTRLKSSLLAIAALGLTLSLSSVARAGRPAGSTFLRGGFECSGQSLDDLKDYQRVNNRTLSAIGLTPPFENVGAGPGFDFEVGYQVRPSISLGIGFSHVRHSKKNSSAGWARVYDGEGNWVGTEYVTLYQDMSASISEITGNVTFRVPRAGGLFLGVQGGLGMAGYEESWAEPAAGSNSTRVFALSSAKYVGIGPVGGVFAGCERPFRGGLSVFAKGGYRLRNLGKLKRSGAGLLPRDWRDMRYFDGSARAWKSVGFDFSGMYGSLGLGFTFHRAAR